MVPISDTPIPVGLKILEKFLDQETICLQRNTTNDISIISPTFIQPRFKPSINHLSVPVDIRNYLLSPPPPPVHESWISRVESPPPTHKDLYQNILTSEKKIEKAKKKGCTVEGITYFIGENSKFKSKKKKKVKGNPSIVVNLCED